MKSIKLNLILIIFLITVFVLASCQPSPEEPVVVNKNDGKLQETIQKSSSESPEEQSSAVITFSEKWTDQITTEKGAVIHIDATVNMPNVQKYPVVKVKTTGFTDQQIQQAVRVLSQGNPISQSSDTMTKEQIQQQIVELQKQINELQDSGSADAQQQIEMLNQMIAQLEKNYENAPATADMERKKTLDINELNASNVNIDIDFGTMFPARIYVTDYRDWGNAGYRCSLSFSNINGSNINYMGTFYQDEPGGDLTISKQEAIKEAEKIIEEMGIDYMQVAHSGIMGDSRSSLDNAEHQCYMIVFTRTYEGVPNPYVFSKEWEQNGFENPTDDQYRLGWAPENITMQINDTGLLSLVWEDPVQIESIESENVPIISFDQIKQKFAQDMQITMADPYATKGWEDRVEIWIDRIDFGMQFIPVKDHLDEYEMMPCWVFYGYSSIIPEEQRASFRFGRVQLILNGIDGSIV
jgi:hypothetical protein